LTYGIFGSWGSGKTSLMRLIKEDIDKKGKNTKKKNRAKSQKVTDTHITVWFNPWRYESEEHPIVPLCASIISEIDSVIDDLDQSFIKLKKALKAIAHGFTFKAAGVELSLSDILDDKKADDIGQLSIVGLALKSLEEFSEKLTEKKIIVFIDDLDRCSPTNAVKLLESIKLILNQPNFIFIFGLDRVTIASYFKEKFRNYQEISGDDYLEKLLQVSVYIPDYSDLISKYAAFLIKSYIGSDVVTEFDPLLPTIGKLCRNNPRMVKRFLNSLILVRESALEKKRQPKKSLISLAFAMAVTIQWPDVAEALENNRDGINKVLAQDIYAGSKVDYMKLKTLASDENNINERVYRRILQDTALNQLIFSNQARTILRSKQNVFGTNIMKARKIGPYLRKRKDPGQSYRSEKKAKIITRGYTYENIIHDDDFKKRVNEIFSDIFDDIQEKSDESYFRKVKWNYPKESEGDVLGTVSDADGNEYYLMKFDHNEHEIYQFIGKKGVKLV
jgi:predicted KAP-like P-loop ATPase